MPSDTRSPPKPRFWLSARKGQCRLCGGLVRKPNGMLAKGRWHAECLHIWRIRSDQTYARTMVFRRDKSVCAQCGCTDEAWELDHKTPLADADRESAAAWDMDNMQTLCREHHRIKTAAETKARRQEGTQA